MKTGLTFNDVLLVPKKGIVSSRSEINTRSRLTKKLFLDIPIMSASSDTVTESAMAIALAEEGGIGIIHRFLTIPEQVVEVKKVKEKKLLVGAAIGIKNGYMERCAALLEAGVDVLSMDIAHAYSDNALQVICEIKQKFPEAELIVGNLATSEGAEAVIQAGADAVKVGVGPGSTCSTRIVTGAGVPQITAVMDCIDVCRKNNVPLIADGGIQSSGDIAKALAAGASSVMCGNLFAGMDESPGVIIEKNGKKYKTYRGMASKSATVEYYKKNGDCMGMEKLLMPEGVHAMIEYNGSARDAIKKLAAGLRSGISYCGAKDIIGMQKNAEFIRITAAGYRESAPHDIEFQ